MSKFYFILCVLVLLMSGCDGGSDTSNDISIETFPLKQAMVDYAEESSPHSFTVSGISQDFSATGAGTLTNGNLSSGTFEGENALIKPLIIKGALSFNGKTEPIFSIETSYFDSNFNLLGMSLEGVKYSIVTSTTDVPTVARVNDAGILYTLDNYPSITNSILSSTSTISYVIEPDTASTAILKMIESKSDGFIKVISFRMTTSGSLTRLTETETDPSIPLSMTTTFMPQNILLGSPSPIGSAPAKLQAALLMKLFSFYTNLGNDPFTIHVIGAPEVAESLRDFVGKSTGKASLESVTEGDGVPSVRCQVVYVGSNLVEAIAYTQNNKVLSITGNIDFVFQGVSLGVGIQNGHPKILLNLSSSRKEDINWNPAILKVADTIE